MSNLQAMTVSVPAVSCEHCVTTIHRVLSPLPGVEAIATDIPTKTVQLRYDRSLLSLEQIAAVLSDEGYPIAR